MPDGLRSDIYHWRSRIHRRQRDFEAAREDAERALELAQGVDDRRKTADAYFQASLVAERTGHWALSRNYAERAKTLFSELDDERTVGRPLNNLGGLSLPRQARAGDRAAEGVVRRRGRGRLAGRRRAGDERTATVPPRPRRLGCRRRARARGAPAPRRQRGLPRRDRTGADRPRPLAPRARPARRGGTCFRSADATFEQLSSVSHRAGAWVALGDLAARRGDAEAARLYRNAAESLQDLRF